MTIALGWWVVPALITWTALALAWWARPTEEAGSLDGLTFNLYRVLTVVVFMAAAIVALAAWLVWALLA